MSRHPAVTARTAPDGIPAERLDALLAVASHCTVHNTLADPPTVTVTLAGATAPAASRSAHSR